MPNMDNIKSTLEVNSNGILISNESLYANIVHEVTGFWEITNKSALDQIVLTPEDLIQPIIE